MRAPASEEQVQRLRRQRPMRAPATQVQVQGLQETQDEILSHWFLLFSAGRRRLRMQPAYVRIYQCMSLYTHINYVSHSHSGTQIYINT